MHVTQLLLNVLNVYIFNKKFSYYLKGGLKVEMPMNLKVSLEQAFVVAKKDRVLIFCVIWTVKIETNYLNIC